MLAHINYLKRKSDFSDFQIVCIPGGFSYGDDLGAGKILSLEIISWLKDGLKRFIDRGGLMLGICNGFQVLAKTGILPEVDFKQKLTLADNDSGRFEDRWVYLKIEKSLPAGRQGKLRIENVWLEGLPEIINLPVAHGEGKFYAEAEILDRIETSGQVALRYVDEFGKTAGYPFNPNGSLNNIAGITDASRRVLGLMPHPERFMFKHHWPFWSKEEVVPFGRKIFENGVKYFKT